jgi:hypothetical protein
MSAMTVRFALVAALVLAVAPHPAAGAAAGITHMQFVDAYVECNNAAWADRSRGQIFSIKELTMADKMRGITSHRAAGFVGENLFFGGVFGDFQPRATTTVGWALATKAFADRGEIEPPFRTRSTALAYLRQRKLTGLDALGDREAGALATELELSARDRKYAITPIPPGTRFTDQLDAASARKMLAKVGTHFDVGSARTLPQAGSPCPPRVLGGLFRHG